MTVLPIHLDGHGAAAARREHVTASDGRRGRWSREFGLIRQRRIASSAAWFAFGQTLFLGIEAWLMPDVAGLAVMLRFAVVAPIALLVARQLSRGKASDVLAAVPAVVAVLAGLAIFLASGDARAIHAHHLIILPILFLCLVQRPAPTVVAGAASGALMLHWASFAVAGVAAPIAIAGAFEALMLVGFAFVAGHLVERDLRRAFLMRLRSEKAIHHLASTNDRLLELTQIDTLTGLANRRRLDERLETAASWSRVAGEPIALLMIDVDHFKQFNDRYGHPEGDRCLARIAAVIRDQMRRQDDMVGRFGGEEFLAILIGTDLAGAAKVAERIRFAIDAQAIPHGGGAAAPTVGVSIGVAAGRMDRGDTVDDLLRGADEALYAAKRAGRNRVTPAVDEGEDLRLRRPLAIVGR